jgi:hypothetical protein
MLPLVVPPPLATPLSYAQHSNDYDDTLVVLEAAIAVDGSSKDGGLCWAVVVGGQVMQ